MLDLLNKTARCGFLQQSRTVNEINHLALIREITMVRRNSARRCGERFRFWG